MRSAQTADFRIAKDIKEVSRNVRVFQLYRRSNGEVFEIGIYLRIDFLQAE